MLKVNVRKATVKEKKEADKILAKKNPNREKQKSVEIKQLEKPK